MFVGPTILTGDGSFCPPDDVVQVRSPFPTLHAMEFEHLQHFKRLVKVQFPRLAFRLASSGSNPPDFMVYRTDDGVPFGMELTTFGFPTQERQSRAWKFARIHERLLKAYEGGRLAGLSGLKFDVSFGALDGSPPDGLDEATFGELVDALEDVAQLSRPSMETNVDSSEAWPSGVVGGGSILWSLSGVTNGCFEGSMLAKRTGFEVECTVREWKTEGELRMQMDETIQAKDVPSNQELLIVAGGPTQQGRMFPAGAVIAMQLVKAWHGPAKVPVHLRRIFLDVWGPEKIFLLYEKQ